MTNRQRIDLIATYGDTEIEELLAYNRNAFDRQGAGPPTSRRATRGGLGALRPGGR